MKEAVVLIDGAIVYLENITDDSVYNPLTTEIIFDSETGRVRQFTKNGKTFMALYDGITNDFLYYTNAKNFWSSATPNDTNYNYEAQINWLDAYKVYTDHPLFGNVYIPVEAGTTVIMCREIYDSLQNQNGDLEVNFYSLKHSFTYPDRKLTSNENFDTGIDVFLNYYSHPSISIPVAHPFIENYLNSFSEKGFIKIINNLPSYYFGQLQNTLITEIAFIFNKIYKNNHFIQFINNVQNSDIKMIFDQHFQNINTVLNDQFGSILFPHPEFHEIYTEPYMNLFRLRLIEFYTWVNSVNINEEESIDIYIRVISLFSENELSKLDYNTKIEILYQLLKDNLWIVGKWNPRYSGNNLTEEEVIVKLIKSIKNKDNSGVLNYDDINDFMDKLARTPFYEGKDSEETSPTLYEVLYDKINPDVIFGGAGARGQLVNAIYDLWISSKYNPKNVVSGYQNYNFSYTENSYVVYDASQDSYDLDQDAAPLLIPYSSTKKWLWYQDNFKFVFRNKKIVAAQEKNALHGIGSVIIQYLMDYIFLQDIPNHTPYGFYHIFQPVNIVSIDPNDTFVKVPFDTSVLENYTNACDVETTGRGSNLPMFYLKYIDDIGDRKDAEESLLSTVDALSVLVGGWGIARRLIAEGAMIAIRNATKIAVTDVTAAINSLTPQVRANLLKTIKSVIKSNAHNTLEFVLGASSIAHTIVTGNCEQYNDCNNTPPTQGSSNFEAYERCQAIQKWLFALEILTLSGDALARKFFKKSTRELRQKLPQNNPYTNISNAKYEELRIKIDGIDDLIDDMNEFLADLNYSHNEVYVIVNPMPEKNKIDFFLDFEGDIDALDQLRANPFLINESWLEFVDLKKFRNDIATLKRYREVSNNNWLQTHTQFGHHELIGSGGTKKAKVSGAHMSIHYVNPPPGSGQVSWINPPPKNTNPDNPDDGYTLGEIERNMSDITDATQSDGIWKGGYKANGSRGGSIKKKNGVENACWPKNYDIFRINQEKAVVLGKIHKNTTPVKIQKNGQYVYEIPATDGHPIIAIFDGNPNNGGTLNNIFPSNDENLFQ